MLSCRQVVCAFRVVCHTRKKPWASDQCIRFCRSNPGDFKLPAMASVQSPPASNGASDVTPMTSLDPVTSASEGTSDVGSGAMSTGSGSGQPGGGMASNDTPRQQEEAASMLGGPSSPSLTSGRGESEGSDSDSDCSGVSDISGLNWKPTAGPICWVQEQIGAGVDPRDILRALRPGLTHIPSHIDNLTLWKVVIEILSEPPRREKLRHINTLSDVVRLIRGARNVIVLTGAGVSVSCGIPDFRSRDGIYARLAVDFPDLPDPQAMFDIQYFRRDPRPFFKFAKEIYPGQFRPSPCHRFIRLLERQGKLLRNYTQNIDTLEQQAGIQNVIQCHGSFATATCQRCRYKVDAEEIREDIFAQKIPRCPRCTPDPLPVNGAQSEKDTSRGFGGSQGRSGDGAETRDDARGGRDDGGEGASAAALAKTPEHLPQSSEDGAGRDDLTFDDGVSNTGSAVASTQDTAASREDESVQQGQRQPQDSASNNVSSAVPDTTESTASSVTTSQAADSSEAKSNATEDDDNLRSSEAQHLAEGRGSGAEAEAGDADQGEEPAATGDEDTGDSGFCVAEPDVDSGGPEVHRLASVMKPDIVFFGEGLSEEFHNAMERDKDACDLLIIIGSSLKVRPVALIPSSIQPDVAQILINREPLPHLNCDVQLLGDCDVIVDHLCHLLGGIYDELHTNPRLSELKELPPRAKTPPPAANPTNEHDTEALKNCWQRKLTESVAARLPSGTYLYQAPSRYIFSGAEVLMDPDDEEEHVDDPDDDDDVDDGGSAAASNKQNGDASEPSTSQAAGETDPPGASAGETDLNGAPVGFSSSRDTARDSLPAADFNVDDALSSVDVTKTVTDNAPAGLPTEKESTVSLSAQDPSHNVNSSDANSGQKRPAGETGLSASPKRHCTRDEHGVSQVEGDAVKTGDNNGVSRAMPEGGNNGVDKS